MMTRWAGLQAVALMLGLASTSFGQGGGFGGVGFGVGFQQFGTAGADNPKKSQVCPVKVVSADGKTSMGALRLTSGVVGCSLGIYEIKPEKIQEIRFDSQPELNQIVMDQTGTQRIGTIVTTSGEVIDGSILIPKWWRVETDLGFLTPSPAGLKSIVFIKKAENSPPAVDGSIPPPGSSPPVVPSPAISPSAESPPLPKS